MKLPPEQEANSAKRIHPSGTFFEFPAKDVETSIPARFEKVVRMYPDRIAVRTDSQTVTYLQLNTMANQVARHILAERGAEPEPVGLLIENGVEQTAAIMGILKANKFFVPFDPVFPLVRNLAIANDTLPSLILVSARQEPYGRKLTSGTTMLIAPDAMDLTSLSDNVGLKISPDSPVCIVYTSGTTGAPKGVIQNHRGKLHSAMVYSSILGLSCRDKYILLTSGTANAFANSGFALLNGAELHPFDVKKHGFSQLIAYLKQEKITVCSVSVQLFRGLCEFLKGDETFSDLRILRLTSEASYKKDFELYKRFFPRSCRLVNMLLPSETGLLRYFLMDHDSEFHCDEIPLGYGVDDTEIVLLDDEGNEVGYNRIGEIVVRSRYLSSGYWRRPELNEAKFKTDPQNADRRIYYTGDLGLMVPGDCLIHKGRKDFRVKVRGYGVEPAEVEKHLNSYVAIGQAVVVARKTTSGGDHLVAYYTCNEASVPTVSELRGFLKTRLPDYMVPSTFVLLTTMPLNASGKIDRRALPKPEHTRPDLATKFSAPRTEIEQTLVSIWEDILQVRSLGVNDRFFDLGGDSLSAGRVISQVLHQYDVEIPFCSLFESPTIAEMAAVIAAHQTGSPRQDRLMHTSAASLVPDRRHNAAPLSFPQQRLWFLDQLDPGSFTYNLFSVCQLKGDLNVAVLEQSINEIIRRHEVLRTVFGTDAGHPVQTVLPNLSIKIPVDDLRDIPSEEVKWTEARRRFTEAAQRPFDLTKGPLLRVGLLRFADDEYLLLRTMHHIVFDGWSGGVLSRELSILYEAIPTGQIVPLPDLTLQYADFSVWQRLRLQDERLESQLSYWRNQLGDLTSLRLPTDRPAHPLQRARGARRYFRISPALSSQLKELSQRQGASVFMTLLTAFQTLLHRYSGQTDIAIGSPVAGRSRKEFEGLIGFFLNTLVLRLDLSGNPPFTEAMRRARDMCVGALSHQELPFEKLVEEIHPDRNLGQNPLFQVTFAFQNTPRDSLRLPGISAEELEAESGIARFDLHLFMEETGGHLKGYFDYDTNLFDPATIERMAGHFVALLNQIAADPDQRIDAVPLLTGPEKEQLLVRWNDTKTDYPRDRCIHELFEGQVAKTPDAIALVFENQQLTYTELNSKANQLAHYLIKLGVGPEVLVGICLERCADMIVALLAVLKAGGAYVPLDPSCPKKRLGFMIEDSQSDVLIAQEKLAASIDHRKFIGLDNDWANVAKESTVNPQCRATAEDIAYVIYTSGSTGTPKGVIIKHRSVVNFLISMARRPGLSENDILLAVTPISFDIAGLEIYLPLSVGGRVVLATRECSGNALILARQLSDCGATVMQGTPATWGMLLATGWRGDRELKILCGGEALSETLARSLTRRCASLYNLYGPTETTIWSTVQQLPADCTKMTVGRPIANTQIYILDAQLNPVPIGVAGELHIGGDGLARGYRNRPELTLEKFIPNPFSADSGARLYKTGDLARYLSDGSIEFLGRIDHQVKIRGFRIELGEIEATLATHPAITQALVLAREETPGEKRLVAYTVAAPGSVLSAADLRHFLQQTLPDYMVPSAFVFLESLPLTLNGKLDRKALPAPDQSREASQEAFVVPRNAVETAIAGVWSEILGKQPIGVHDNFFDLGGHSLKATEVVSRLRLKFESEIPLRHMFEYPTIAELAAAITVSLTGKNVDAKNVDQLLTEIEATPEGEAQNLLRPEKTDSGKA